MQLQTTINSSFTITGKDVYGGSTVKFTAYPAPPDTGIVFQTPYGSVKADLEHAIALKGSIFAPKNSIALRNGNGVEVLVVEHPLATLAAYGIQNAIINIERTKKSPFLWTKSQVAPTPYDREKTLCDRLDEVGICPQGAPLDVYRLVKDYHSPKFSVERIEGDEVRINATTVYRIPKKETVEFPLSAQVYKKEIAKSRPYGKEKPVWMSVPVAKAIVSFLNPSFGIGFGYDENTLFLRTKTLEQWRAQEFPGYKGEIARHTWEDRAGELKLLEGQLKGVLKGVKITTKFASHGDVLKVFNEMVAKGYFVKETQEALQRVS